MSLASSPNAVVALNAPGQVGFAEKIWRINWGLALVLTAIAGIGVLALYSAAGGRLDPWAARHAVRYGAAVVGVTAYAQNDWPGADIESFMSTTVHFADGGVARVETHYQARLGKPRWLVVGPMQIQPSEIAKVAVIVVLARYYHGLGKEQAERFLYALPPLALILVPVALVMVQPDLGTAMMVLLAGAAMLFVAGVRLWMFLAAGIAAVGCLPIAWSFMHEYQRKRVLTFLDPDRDPLGAGYHITQSKIAIGSGGLFGKGFLKGTQSSLNFLPEKQTDFIFTTFVEEWGMAGALVLLGLFALVLVWGFSIALRSQHHFGRLVALGVTAMMFLYVFINTAMVMGLLPVVGVPLPLVSNGGTAMVSVMFACGLLIGVNVYRDAQLPLVR